MTAETEWYPERLLLRWIVKRRLWSDFAGSAYEIDKYRKGVWRKFWTRKGAQARADLLNAHPGGSDLHNLHCGYPKCDRRPTIVQWPAAVNEAAIRYALDHARDLDDGVTRVVAAIAQQPAAVDEAMKADAEELALVAKELGLDDPLAQRILSVRTRVLAAAFRSAQPGGES